MERQAFLLAAFSAVLLIPLVAADASAYCAVDVYQVEVEGSVITGNIRNIGNESASISYSIWVENNGDDVVKSGSLLMEPGQVRLFSQAYGFSQGVYTVTINASADCGAWDEESMGHMVLEDFSCRNPYANEGEYGSPGPRAAGTTAMSALTCAETEYAIAARPLTHATMTAGMANARLATLRHTGAPATRGRGFTGA